MDYFDTTLAFTNMHTHFQRKFEFEFKKKISVKFTRKKNCLQNFDLLTFVTAYKVGYYCPLYTGKVSRFFEIVFVVKYIIYM